ncbi:alpha/beta fold hydrolase [Paraburkholderia caballeronis]|uniref:Pimeloyl-ACP methyl ester carboxylesterase n=1 Tax=Paraburkholderia caballeronis TaxID=416943 RepID=A0A1H7KSG4_9BURK|nr:alpha/beta hydrolase [Paraburkholderia caballeronis]PXW28137.1 pimeloyl-ACP methyl ester carboxylesterase [Paraburkholderia caballeronis]PXX03503.1 pimeloyl-ACP methyl ester carboxylesterase [Paraburkholderia caballeronis]RAK04247.1 pimeloyl-ACP methyl ester carboxylesterase [Paraburkholderia caballeronis]SED87800.1 Pimeloyl-ACP methyl ester carboxylesterase [Paraburkholderia caballeronis]SEK89494.1 Pimeloyl-ACP methyl ester carboxylesterase [Paraburkholderia caballeronis]
MKISAFRSVAAQAAAALCVFTAATAPALAAPVKNIVLVHGAFVGGAGWRPVYDILTKDGYNVTLVQEPLTSFNDDVTATKRVLDSLNGPCVLVGHSYGGAIVTEAGNDGHVKSLVYIAAHALDAGETEVGNGKKYPNSLGGAVVKTPDNFLYLNPADYPADFAADLPRAQAEFEAHAQMPTAAAVFTAQIDDPAWKKKPSWYMVAKADKIINPDLERMYAARAHSHTVEIAGASHSVYESHPKQVAALIEQAAQQSDQ